MSPRVRARRAHVDEFGGLCHRGAAAEEQVEFAGRVDGSWEGRVPHGVDGQMSETFPEKPGLFAAGVGEVAEGVCIAMSAM